MTEIKFDFTNDWVRNISDEKAVANGCRFNAARGAFAVWWIERYCRLYEGDGAGEPLTLRGCHECGDYGLGIPQDWEHGGLDTYLERAARFAECQKAAHALDWQFDCTMRTFGWVRWSDRWKQWIRRFREVSIWISKKNKKSPTMAAWMNYMLAGDEEPGQKIFPCSKDGQQIRKNVASHSIESVMQSPELLEVCTINKNEYSIKHEPSRSLLFPLSSSNVRTQKSKEGLNGSIFVDETHVVDREFMNRISRAGISRKEPLLAEFSTSGDDPDSYGKERFDLAVRVLDGTEERQEMFAAVYAAPQDLKPNELDADPMKYGRMANPAMGHTVGEDEFLMDYRNSKGSPASLAQFCMYRLNIWQSSAAPWLNAQGWDSGAREFAVADFYGRQCWASLDLSSVCDFSALTLTFPEGDDEFSQLWWYWLPEDTARKFRHLIPIDRWIKDPRTNLELTPGGRIWFGAIQSKFRELAEQFQIEELSYDDWNAEKETQELHEGVQDHHGKIILPGTGIPRLEFSQGIRAFNEPTKRFEAAVIDGKIHHNGDPLTRWMMMNATIKPDQNANYKPIKGKDLTKKIDGVITAVMGFWRATLSGQQYTFQPGSLAL